MALTGSFITYGAGQLVSGVLGDHISPKKLIFLGLSLTVLMNLCIPFCRNPYQMLVVWCFNGFAQSFLWPPLISFWGWRTVFFFSAICGIIMILVWNRYCEDAPVISILLTGCMHGVNLIQVCMIPPFFKKQGNVSTVSGVLNSCTYIGSATSTYGIAVLSDRIVWSSTLLIWVLLTFAGTLICIACARPWRKKFL